jgi:predicted deacylase/ubiquinone/menaquinone biosynthesis C-methylase UbiE
MLIEARRNAKELADQIQWQTGDAQNLAFAEGTFDAVVTRNVTWNLPEPEKAYGEWYRVLKKDGLLLNFDADWYGHLFDEKKQQAYEADRKKVAEEQLEDYYGNTDNERMEEIARAVPLSRLPRPKWDLDVMKKSGFSGVSCEEEVWKEVWTKEEIANNASTPLFLLSGVKREAFCLCNMKVEAGACVNGFLELGEHAEFHLPATIWHGVHPGKTVLVMAGIHAGEYVGIQAAIELSKKLKAEKVAGTILLLKVVNRPAFEARNGSMGLTDHKNLNRVFPGNPNGTEMERLAHAITTELFPVADYCIDLHSGDDYEELTPYVYYAGMAEESVVRMSRQMAEQVDVPYMVKSNVSSGGAYNYAASIGIPSVLIERGGMGLWSKEESRSTRRDVQNILRHLGIYQEEKDYRTYYPLDVTDVYYQNSTFQGLWYPFKKAGDLVQKKELLGEVRDYEGRCIEQSIAEYDGVILYQTKTLQVLANGPLISYGRIVKKQDERKEKIVKYWEKRSESFLSQRRAELHSVMAGRWLREIHKQIEGLQKEASPRTLRILDVGCGTGFFTILLAQQGYEVTGIDLTPKMIENAKILAKEEGCACEFCCMDAEKLEFPDESFDVVISRNLTWTVPDAMQAYGEWVRVLRKGGILLNFDANYGKENFTDTSDLPEKHAHHMVGDEMMQECEAIKRQLPISSYNRPAWDLTVLGRMKLEQFAIDLGINSRIYIEKDEFYNPTPMFMICAKKS